jgi:hypothetical protein
MTNDDKKVVFLEKVAQKLYCDICNYKCSKSYDMNKHMLTAKHTNRYKKTTNDDAGEKNNNCECGKKYAYRQGLFAHKKKCDFKKTEVPQCEPAYENTLLSNMIDTSVIPYAADNTLIIEILKQNQDFKELIIEQNKNMMELATKVGSTTNHIKQQNNFNLQIFLNETCKDAIDINDFVKSIPVSFSQLENIDQNGYVVGITDIILTQLKKMDITKRPLHCTDLKRDTMYIKEADAWIKDTNENTKMKQIFRRIANNNVRTLHAWSQQNPISQIMDTKEHTFCINVMLNSLGLIGDAQLKLDEKVIKNIAKMVHVDRNIL